MLPIVGIEDVEVVCKSHAFAAGGIDSEDVRYRARGPTQ